MGGGRQLLRRFAEGAEVSLPNVPIVEIAGEGRVLVEGHGGVMAYSSESILVKLAYGAVCVCGQGLELRRMSREQLIILGKIDSVTLRRRGEP